MFHATAHGLRISCDFEVPDFDPTGGSAAPDIVIRESKLGAAWSWHGQREGWINVTDHGRLIRIDVPDCANFLISEGREILYAPVKAPVGGSARLKAFLLGRILSAALYQRGLFPLHASCIAINGRAFVFAGDSGMGKSTLCQFLMERGHVLIADDVLCLASPGQGTVVWPGIRRTKLWSDTLDWFGHSAVGLEPVEEQGGKFHMRRKDVLPADPIDVHAVVLLRAFSACQTPYLSPLPKLDVLNLLSSQSYLWPFVPTLGLGAAFVEYALKMQKGTSFFTLERPQGLDQLESIETTLLDLQVAIS